MHKSTKCKAKNVLNECELNWLIGFTLRWTRTRDKPRSVYLLRLFLKSKISSFSISGTTCPSKYLGIRYRNVYVHCLRFHNISIYGLGCSVRQNSIYIIYGFLVVQKYNSKGAKNWYNDKSLNIYSWKNMMSWLIKYYFSTVCS